MTGFGHDPLLGQQSDQNKNGRPSFGSSFLRLYRQNDTWRGAFDLVFIGCFVMFLALGFPDITKAVNKLLPSAQEQETSESAKPAKQDAKEAAEKSANFQPPPDSPQNNQPAQSSIPNLKPKRADGIIDPVWINSPSKEDLEILGQANDMIGGNNAAAIELVKEKAEAGDPNFQYILGVLYVSEAFQSKINATLSNMDRAIYWYKESAAQGHPDAQYQLGQMFRLGQKGLSRNLEEAEKWYRLAADNPADKNGNAENQLGRWYEKGLHLKKNPNKSIEYYTRSAEKGNKHAQLNLGAIYYNREFVPRDLEKSRFWTEKSAEQGHAKAQLNLGLMYYRGRVSGSPDYLNFLKWTGLAAEQGDVNAMIALGDFYRHGKPGYEIDHKLAAKFYRQAALKKNPKAQFVFGEMYEQGLGVPQDLIQAYIYYNFSYENAYTPAISAWNNLRKKMSPAQLEHAEKMVKALKASD